MDISQRTQFHQVFVAFRVFGQEELVVAFILVLFGKSAAVPVVNHIKFATHDGFYPFVFGRFRYELEYAEHVTVISNGQCFHAIGRRLNSGNKPHAVEQGVLGVAVEVCELGHDFVL